jgi:membrane-bound lytic murein transglycosylase D
MPADLVILHYPTKANMTLTQFVKNIVYAIAFFLSFLFIYAGVRMLVPFSGVNADYAGPSQSLFNLRIPKDLSFAGEPIPRDDYSIKENMEKVINGGKFERSTAYVLFSRASAWFPMIERILKKHNIPDDFKYIALAESRLTNSISPQGAVGFWQFVPATGSHYGLEISSEVDERYNVEKSTEAACRYFKDAYRRFGNWTLVAASYNLGMGGIEQHLRKQGSKNYYNLLMNKETSVYIYRILALKTIFMNSGKKFYGGKNIYNMSGVTYKTDSSIVDLAQFAKTKGCNLEILKTFNPWLVGKSLLNPEHKTYYIKLPGKDYLKLVPAIAASDTAQQAADTSASRLAVPDSSSRVRPDSTKETRNEQP